MDDLMAAFPPIQPEPLRHRNEGFPGQHMVVLPSLLVHSLHQDPLLRDLFVTATGHFPKAPGHLVQRSRGIEDVILIRILGGEGWVDTGTRQKAEGGSLILIPAGAPHSYGAEEKNPWVIEWVHFQGTSAGAFAELFEAAHSARVLRKKGSELGAPGFAPLYHRLERGLTRLHLLDSAAVLRSLLTELHSTLLMGASGDSEEAVLSSADWMLANPGAQISLNDLARAAGLSVPHYCTLFKRLTGYPPIEHFHRLKIQRACQMLDTSNLRISEIGERLGWEDPLYFSRCFRKITGKSPKSWRANTKG